MKQISRSLAIVLAMLLVSFAGCKKSENSASNSNSGGGGNTTSDVRVTTYTPQDITENTADCGGDVIVTQGLSLTEIGICWNTDGEPVVSDDKLSTEVWNEPFVCTMTGLSPATKYYVRAYALRGLEYYYGDVKTFTTLDHVLLDGSLPGEFSINATQQVHFSQGNLQYQASTNTWRFAEHQYDYVGGDNSNISSTYSGWIDLFGWGTSGYNHGAVCYQPWSTSTTNSDYYAYGSYLNNLEDQSGIADWGYNSISNGGNSEHLWRTLTNEEWLYLFSTRNTPSGIRYAKAQVNGVKGVILLPDNWSSSIYQLNNTNSPGADYVSNYIVQSEWTTRMEPKGAVFLPAAGYRYGTHVYDVGFRGYYWSATYGDSVGAYNVYFNYVEIDAGLWYGRYYGQSVRLVCSAEN